MDRAAAVPPFGEASVNFTPASLNTKYGVANSSSQKPVFRPVLPSSSCDVSAIKIFMFGLRIRAVQPSDSRPEADEPLQQTDRCHTTIHARQIRVGRHHFRDVKPIASRATLSRHRQEESASERHLLHRSEGSSLLCKPQKGCVFPAPIAKENLRSL